MQESHVKEFIPSTNIENTKKGIAGSTLKLIAITAMLIDHIGAAILENNTVTRLALRHGGSYETWTSIDLALRLIGRIAFPIFCFLLVEGFFHTRNVKKYALRLGVFCLLSEIPFDLAFCHQATFLEHQNVFFTLFIGLLVLMGLKYFEGSEINRRICRILCILAGTAAAVLLRTDYSAYGVCIVVLFYLFRQHSVLRDISAAVVLILCSPLEITGLAAFLPIHLYNGKRGSSVKYFFYLFYPVHLLLLCGIRLVICQILR